MQLPAPPTEEGTDADPSPLESMIGVDVENGGAHLLGEVKQR